MSSVDSPAPPPPPPDAPKPPDRTQEPIVNEDVSRRTEDTPTRPSSGGGDSPAISAPPAAAAERIAAAEVESSIADPGATPDNSAVHNIEDRTQAGVEEFHPDAAQTARLTEPIANEDLSGRTEDTPTRPSSGGGDSPPISAPPAAAAEGIAAAEVESSTANPGATRDNSAVHNIEDGTHAGVEEFHQDAAQAARVTDETVPPDTVAATETSNTPATEIGSGGGAVPPDGRAPSTPMDKWEAAEDRIMAENIVSIRQEAEILGQQGNHQAANDLEEFIGKLPVSDDIKADPQGYINRLAENGAATSEAPPAPKTASESAGRQSTPMHNWEAAEDRIMAENIVSIRQEAEILGQQGNHQAANDLEEFIGKLPVSDDIKADPQGYINRVDQQNGTREQPVSDSSQPAQSDSPSQRFDKAAGQADGAYRSESPRAESIQKERPEVQFSRPELGRAWNDGLDTNGGRAYYEPSDTKTRLAAERLKPFEDEYTVDMHGSPDSVHFGGSSFDSGELAELIRADPRWDNDPVRLMSCETGRGERPIAQTLATELEVPVTAPTELVWSGSDGEATVAPAVWRQVDGLWVRVPGDTPADGGWRTFRPDNQR